MALTDMSGLAMGLPAASFQGRIADIELQISKSKDQMKDKSPIPPIAKGVGFL